MNFILFPLVSSTQVINSPLSGNWSGEDIVDHGFGLLLYQSNYAYKTPNLNVLAQCYRNIYALESHAMSFFTVTLSNDLEVYLIKIQDSSVFNLFCRM